MQKNIVIESLNKWIKQRPGLDYANYGEPKSYRDELRSITRSYHDARELLAFVAMRDGITADDILAAAKGAYSGRLSIDAGTGEINYCTGQYWPTEYRAAAAAVLSQAIWAYYRCGHDTGDAIRKAARAEFGRGIASRWFN